MRVIAVPIFRIILLLLMTSVGLSVTPAEAMGDEAVTLQAATTSVLIHDSGGIRDLAVDGTQLYWSVERNDYDGGGALTTMHSTGAIRPRLLLNQHSDHGIWCSAQRICIG
ncbi:MAG: hypothetical protein HGA19_00385 [Oscillochloris sp.]|nr:hypothetical protein [Oscillochloris sp.]